MKITIDLPSYAVEILSRDAKSRGQSLAVGIGRHMLERADSLISVRWLHLKSRRCHKCNAFADAPLGCEMSNPPPRKCAQCGARFSGERNRIGVVGSDGKNLRGAERAAWYKATEKFMVKWSAI